MKKIKSGDLNDEQELFGRYPLISFYKDLVNSSINA